MGIFNMHYDRPGPGVAKDAPRKTGFARWFEIVGRDMGDFTKANLVTFACFLPTLIVLYLALIWIFADPNLLIMGLGILLGSAFGVISGPAMCAMEAIMLKSLRDEPKFFWHTYKKAFKENFKKGAITGVVFSFLVLLQVFGFVMYFTTGISAWMIALLFLDVTLITMVMLFFIPQVVLMDLSLKAIFTNSLRLSLGFLPRSLPAALIQLALFGAQALFMPLSAPIFLFIGIWIPVFSGLFLVYKPLDTVFHIEEQFTARREQEMQQLEKENSASL